MVTRVVLVGLGATGLAIAKSLFRRNDIEVVGAADKAADTIGSDLGEMVGFGTANVTVVQDASELPVADLAVVATTSDLNQVAETLAPLIERPYNILSICEELAFPWLSHPQVAQRLDEAAKASGVSILGTGANPGVLMDTLPLMLTVLTQRAERITIRRRTSMSRYGAILSKFGLGLTHEEFADAQAVGEVVGHCGFEQAISAVSSGLGWRLDAIEVDDVAPAEISQTVRPGDYLTIEPGQISAVTHSARGIYNDRAIIDLSITFGFFDSSDSITVGDEYRIDGVDQAIEFWSTVGFESFISTVATAVNTAVAVVDATPGLISMGDLPVRAFSAKGSFLAREEGAS